MSRHRLAAVLAVTIIVRLAIFVALPGLFRFEQTETIHGSTAYDTYALNLLSTGVYGREAGQPDALIPPLYSYALAGVYGLFGRSALPVIAFHIALDCLSIILLYHTACRLLPRGDRVGALAGLFYACYPYLIFQNLTLIDTPFFMVQLHAFVLILVMLRARSGLDRRTLALAVVGGVVLGLSMLTRAILPPLALLAVIWFRFQLSWRQTILRLLPVAVVGVLVVLPWVVRNFGVYRELIPTSLNFGDNFYQGNSPYTIPYFRAGYDVQWVPPARPLDADDPFSPQASRERVGWALDYLRANPGQIPDLLWTKLLVHWSIDVAPRLNPTEGQVPRLNYQGDPIVETGEGGQIELGGLPPGDPVGVYSQPLFDQLGRAVHRFYWGGLFLLGLAGIVLTRRYWREVSLLWFVQISMTLIYAGIFHPATRYRVPGDPLYFIFSAQAVIAFWLWWQTRRERRLIPSAGGPITRAD